MHRKDHTGIFAVEALTPLHYYRMSKVVSKLLFFATGVVAGTAVGILFAPDDGRSTRDRLSFQLSRTRERLAEMVNRLRAAENNGQNSEARVASDRIIKETEEEAEKLLSDVEALMRQIRGHNAD